MPAKKGKETPDGQIERFRKAVRDLVDAGELNPTEADKRINDVLSGAAQAVTKRNS